MSIVERKIEIVTMDDEIDKMLHKKKHGQEKGSSTHVPNIDNCWKWRKGEFNIWTGYGNEGKSLLIRYLAIIKALVDGWKFVISAPEDYPADEFFDDMLHTLCGQTTDPLNPSQVVVSDEKYLRAYKLLKDHFTFVYVPPPHNTLKMVMDIMAPIIVDKKAEGAIFDPLIKFSRPIDVSDRDDLYAMYVTALMTDFSRTLQTSTHLVMHQVTPKVNEQGLYPEPSMYSVKGGGTWADGTDNVLSVQRPQYAKDKLDTTVIFGSQKIKKQKLVAIPQKFEMKFDRKINQYTDIQGKPLFDFTKYLK